MLNWNFKCFVLTEFQLVRHCVSVCLKTFFKKNIQFNVMFTSLSVSYK